MQENLEKIKRFFKYNMNIKNILFNTKPQEIDKYNKETLIKYSDKLFQAINDIEYYMNVMLEDFNFLDEDKKYFNNYIKALKNELIKCGYDFNKLSTFYTTCFTNMSEELVNKVGNQIKGASMYSYVDLKEAKSLNEMLHIVHQTIINNENNFRNLPVISRKQNHEGNNITLYGEDTTISRVVFNSIPISIDTDFVEIMSVDETKVNLMIRDIGHALSIEIEQKDDKCIIRYFIPKICNIDMVNNLKGVNKVKKGDNYTVGVFETTLEKLPFELSNLILGVPTDIDMFKEGGVYYNEDVENKTL